GLLLGCHDASPVVRDGEAGSAPAALPSPGPHSYLVAGARARQFRSECCFFQQVRHVPHLLAQGRSRGGGTTPSPRSGHRRPHRAAAPAPSRREPSLGNRASALPSTPAPDKAAPVARDAVRSTAAPRLRLPDR